LTVGSTEDILRLVPKGRRVLMETESKAILEQWGIPTVSCQVATTQEEALTLARSVGFPVVLKVLSPDIIHKTEVGGVRLNLASDEAVESAFDEVMENARSKSPSASILGVSVQKMVSGLEVAAGVAKDPQFGHVLMFGMGGVDIELIRDTTFRLIPIDAVDAQEMIRDIRGYSILKGDRGPGVDLESLRTMLVQVSNLAVAHPQIGGMDLNPIIASPSGSVVADARIVVSLGEGRDAG